MFRLSLALQAVLFASRDKVTALSATAQPCKSLLRQLRALSIWERNKQSVASKNDNVQDDERFDSFGLLAATLVACGGGGGGGDGGGNGGNGNASDNNLTASNAQVIALVTSSNIQAPAATAIGLTGTWRWLNTPAQHIAVYVPPPATGNATEQDYAAKTQTSIGIINKKLAGLVVLDQVGSIPASGKYIRASYGTAYVPPGSTTNFNPWTCEQGTPMNN